MTSTARAISSPKEKKPFARSKREMRYAYIIIIPILAYTCLWNLVPLIYGLFLGFTEYDALGSAPKWVGLRNFQTFFQVPEYMILLWRQIWLGMLALVCNTIVSFVLALALNVTSKLKSVFRAAVYIPNIAATTATTAVFIALLNPLPDQGLNRMITALGGNSVTWNYSASWLTFWIVIYFVWKSCGPATIIWLGGFQGVDPSLYEAAKVDGANFWKQIRYITIPGLRFVTMFILLTGIIGAMQMFDVIMFISKGNPFSQTDVLMYRIYRDGIKNFNLGMAGAESMILGLVTVVFAFAYLYFQRKRED